MAYHRSHGGVEINIRCSCAPTVEGVPSRRRCGAARPSYYSLHRLKQGPGEPLRKYIRRFRQMQRKILDLPAATIIMAFYLNVRSVSIIEKLAARWVHTVAELYSLCIQVCPSRGRGHPRGSWQAWTLRAEVEACAAGENSLAKSMARSQRRGAPSS